VFGFLALIYVLAIVLLGGATFAVLRAQPRTARGT
jgi:hypothetical protein